MIRRKEEIRKEPDKNIKGIKREVVHADCDQEVSRKFTHEPLGEPHPRISPPGPQLPTKPQVLDTDLPPLCNQLLMNTWEYSSECQSGK